MSPYPPRSPPCSCCHPAGHNARGSLNISISQSRVRGSLATDNGLASGHCHRQWLLPSMWTRGSLCHQSPMYQTQYCCIDFTLICIQIVHNKHCTSALTSHLSCCLSLNWIRRKISRGKQKLDQIGHEFHFYKSFLK